MAWKVIGTALIGCLLLLQAPLAQAQNYGGDAALNNPGNGGGPYTSPVQFSGSYDVWIENGTQGQQFNVSYYDVFEYDTLSNDYTGYQGRYTVTLDSLGNWTASWQDATSFAMPAGTHTGDTYACLSVFDGNWNLTGGVCSLKDSATFTSQ
jgi:hypothetical protein